MHLLLLALHTGSEVLLVPSVHTALLGERGRYADSSHSP